MIKKNSLVLLVSLAVCQVNAQTIEDMPQESLPQASKTLIEQIKAECFRWADEDGYVKDIKRKWVLKCINLELDIEGFRPIKTLD
jgi:hypothetical protein